MGFAAAAARAPAPTLLTIVRLPSNDVGKAAEAAKNGADAIIIDDADAGKVTQAVGKADETAIGARPKAEPNAVEVVALRDAGADFVVLDVATALAEVLLQDKIGFVLQVSLERDDAGLRQLADLGLDAIIVPVAQGALLIEQMLALRRVSALSRVAVLVEVKTEVSANELQVLRESGVAGVIIDSTSLGKIGRLREAIGSLPARGKKREEHGEATIPPLAGVSSDHDHDDDDD